MGQPWKPTMCQNQRATKSFFFGLQVPFGIMDISKPYLFHEILSFLQTLQLPFFVWKPFNFLVITPGFFVVGGSGGKRWGGAGGGCSWRPACEVGKDSSIGHQFITHFCWPFFFFDKPGKKQVQVFFVFKATLGSGVLKKLLISCC